MFPFLSKMSSRAFGLARSFWKRLRFSGLGFEKVAGAFSRSIPLRISRTGEILEKRISPKVPPMIAGFWDSVLDCLVAELPGKKAGGDLAEWGGTYADSFAVYEMDFRVLPGRILERQKRRVLRLISQGGGNSLAGLEPMAKGVSGLDRIQFSEGNGLLQRESSTPSCIWRLAR